jgi:hypothetical protein
LRTLGLRERLRYVVETLNLGRLICKGSGSGVRQS